MCFSTTSRLVFASRPPMTSMSLDEMNHLYRSNHFSFLCLRGTGTLSSGMPAVSNSSSSRLVCFMASLAPAAFSADFLYCSYNREAFSNADRRRSRMTG
ncbi:hypothetical protein ES703_00741 [subsurface metagenome]